MEKTPKRKARHELHSGARLMDGGGFVFLFLFIFAIVLAIAIACGDE